MNKNISKTTIRINKDLYIKSKKLAKSQNRSFNKMIINILEQQNFDKI